MEAGAVPRVAPPVVSTLTPRLLRLASDARLVGLVRDGRDGAFEMIYDRHYRAIHSFCRHMLGDADEAEDAVQHTFMAAYSDLMSSSKPIHLRPWLFAIARNRCLSILRVRRERPSSEIEETATEGLAVQVQRRQDLRDLVSDLRRLPEEQRAAIVLAELDALSHAEIGETLNVPREKVKALVFQARESLLASRTARDTACAEIREQLAVGRGGALRRATLRRHLRECDGCREFRAEVERQRRRFALLLPVAPTLALKEGAIAAAVGTGGIAAVGGGVIATSAIKTGLAKGLIAAMVAGIGAAGTVAVSVVNLPVQSLLHLSHSAIGGGHSSAGPAATAAHRVRAHAGNSATPSRSAEIPAAGGSTSLTGHLGGALSSPRARSAAPSLGGGAHPVPIHHSHRAPAPVQQPTSHTLRVPVTGAPGSGTAYPSPPPALAHASSAGTGNGAEQGHHRIGYGSPSQGAGHGRGNGGNDHSQGQHQANAQGQGNGGSGHRYGNDQGRGRGRTSGNGGSDFAHGHGQHTAQDQGQGNGGSGYGHSDAGSGHGQGQGQAGSGQGQGQGGQGQGGQGQGNGGNGQGHGGNGQGDGGH